MIKRLGRYARQHHIALIALFVAMGGTSYAAATGSIDSREIKNNTVKSTDLRNNGIRSRDVRNGGLLKEDFKAGQLPAGAQGPQGSQGPRGLTGAPGATGAAFPTGNLPSGRTMRGVYSVTGTGSGPSETDHISFPVQLASGPAVWMKREDPFEPGNPTPQNCSGSPSNPQAAPGVLCIYEFDRSGNVGSPGLCSPLSLTCSNITTTGSRWGAFVQFTGVGAGNWSSNGTWAVTAP